MNCLGPEFEKGFSKFNKENVGRRDGRKGIADIIKATWQVLAVGKNRPILEPPFLKEQIHNCYWLLHRLGSIHAGQCKSSGYWRKSFMVRIFWRCYSRTLSLLLKCFWFSEAYVIPGESWFRKSIAKISVCGTLDAIESWMIFSGMYDWVSQKRRKDIFIRGIGLICYVSSYSKERIETAVVLCWNLVSTFFVQGCFYVKAI